MKTKTKNFSQAYKIIYDIFLNQYAQKNIKPTLRGFCDFLGISLGKRQAWDERGQWPSAEDLEILHEKMQFSYQWLITGKGDMFDSVDGDASTIPQSPEIPQKIASVPVIGFASCSLLGWDGEMTIPVSACAPHITPRTIAVMANGESMIPAGIGHGHLCFCEPDLEPLRGDIVYVRRHDNLGTLKTFLGWGLEAGVPEATKGELCLRGWLDRNEFGQQKEIILTVDKILIKTVAPVVFVRRRM